MNRQGHVGMTLLAFAPVAYVLVTNGNLVLAVLGWLGVHAVEPLPDQDFHLPGLSHRGVSHSLLAVLVVGSVLGAGGWLLGDRLFDVVYGVFSVSGELWGWLLDHLPDLSASLLAGLVPNIPPAEIVATIKQQAGGTVDRRGFAMFGFAVGAGGVLAHLLGDVITMQGIKPLLPISRWRFSLSSLRADSPVANSALFGLGVVAIVVVVAATVPGAVLGASTPADLSPVDVAAGQSTTQTTNQTTPQTQNANSTNATVELRNQTTNGSTVTVQSVTLSEPGFVTLHTSSYADDFVGPNESVIAVSKRLPTGTHRNVTINVSHAPPGNAPGLNQSQLNETQTLAAAVYGDSNDNKRLDSVRPLGENDTILMNNGSVVRDTARVRVPSPPRQTASVAIDNQTLQNQTQQKTLVVERARLPDGGFLVALNASYQQTDDPLMSVVGVSDYLSSGTHTNVSLDMRPGGLSRTQVVTVQPARDTNDNQQYDFVGSDGFQDVAYENRTASQSEVITASARVRVPGSDRVTQPAETQRREQTPEQTTPMTGAATSPTTVAEGDVKGSDAPFGLSWLQLGVGVLIVVVVLPTLSRSLRS